MIGLVATLRVQPGKEAEFEAAFGALAAQVRANELGNHLYQLCRVRDEASTYRVLELYSSEGALEAHRKSDHFRAAGPALGATLAGPPAIEMLDAIG